MTSTSKPTVEIEALKQEFVKTLDRVTKAMQEKVDDERRLRAEAEKLNEHLQDKVSNLERKLQGWDESDSGHPVSTSGRTTIIYTGSYETYPLVRKVPGTAAKSTFSSSGKDTGNGR